VAVILLEASALAQVAWHDRDLEFASHFLATPHAHPCLRQGFDPLGGDLGLAPLAETLPGQHCAGSSSTESPPTKEYSPAAETFHPLPLLVPLPLDAVFDFRERLVHTEEQDEDLAVDAHHHRSDDQDRQAQEYLKKGGTGRLAEQEQTRDRH